MKKMKKSKKATLLLGEGTNQHTLYGDFLIEPNHGDFAEVIVKTDSLLKHEKPNGAFSDEHKALPMDVGGWVMGRQVEWNPFRQEITVVWD